MCICDKTVFEKARVQLTFRTKVTPGGGEEGEERNVKMKFWVFKWAHG